VSPTWVLGIEGDVQWANHAKSTSGIPGAENPTVVGSPGIDSATVRQTWDASIRARVGFLFNPSWMVFGTGGVAFTHLEASAFCGTAWPVGWCTTPANIGATSTTVANRAGWTVGAGIEGKLFAPNWLGRVEYRYANYGNNIGFSFFPATTIDTATGNVGLQTHTVTVGLAYKFGGPVVAKY
jgi:outer membrane immunogenic protein